MLKTYEMFTVYGFYYYSCIFISKIRNMISCEGDCNSFFISVKVCQVLMAIQMMTAMMMIVMTIKATHPMMIQYAGVRPHHQQETHPTPAPEVHCENLGITTETRKSHGSALAPPETSVSISPRTRTTMYSQ